MDQNIIHRNRSVFIDAQQTIFTRQTKAQLVQRIRQAFIEEKLSDIEDLAQFFSNPYSLETSINTISNEYSSHNTETESNDRGINEYLSNNEGYPDDSTIVGDSSSSNDAGYSELLSNSLLVSVEDKRTIDYINEQIEETNLTQIYERYWDGDNSANRYNMLYIGEVVSSIYGNGDKSNDFNIDSIMSANV